MDQEWQPAFTQSLSCASQIPRNLSASFHVVSSDERGMLISTTRQNAPNIQTLEKKDLF